MGRDGAGRTLEARGGGHTREKYSLCSCPCDFGQRESW